MITNCCASHQLSSKWQSSEHNVDIQRILSLLIIHIINKQKISAINFYLSFISDIIYVNILLFYLRKELVYFIQIRNIIKQQVHIKSDDFRKERITMLELNLVYFEGSCTHHIGFRTLRNGGYIAVRIIAGVLVMKHADQKAEPEKYGYFIDLSQDTFIGFLRWYCSEKKISGLQFIEKDGTYYEMYDGDEAQIVRAINFSKEQTRMELLTGQISTHYLIYPEPIHDDSEDNDI